MGAGVLVVSVHSFRGGTGKSNLTANLAVQLAQAGSRVGVIDTDLQSPGVHVPFGLRGPELPASLNDYLFGTRTIAEVALDVTPDGVAGVVHLVPSSVEPGQITRVLRDGYDAELLVRGLRDLVDACELDVLLVDTHPGLGEETLLSVAISDTVLVVLRPDQQDYEGTAVLLDVAGGLQVPRTALVVNKVPGAHDLGEVRQRVHDAYATEVVGVLRHDEEMMALASRGVFSLRHPDHPLTAALGEVTRFVRAGAAR
ncbi:MinD/ParA family ATP-binding protein [Nitriliruptor alkaliphilus]|uniref:MinD/ParA family ATP-binding protein n=1 Tax=Nitriliruptor alkaliphilus TaxID=427918 RepID=UPI000AF051C0|nr:MinD/ParA family protein [Nitriliruptor alkaliphilus]